MRGTAEPITGSRSGTMRVAALLFFELLLHLRERRGILSRIGDIVQLVGIFREIVKLAAAIIVMRVFELVGSHHGSAVLAGSSLRGEDGTLGVAFGAFPSFDQRLSRNVARSLQAHEIAKGGEQVDAGH